MKPITSKIEFEDRITIGVTTESIDFDFKALIDWKIDGMEFEIAKDIASFANAYGGTIIIGLGETKIGNGKKVAGGIANLKDVENYRKRIENDVRKRLSPDSIRYHFASIDLEKDVSIGCINIEPLVNRLACAISHDNVSYSYPYRTNFGKEYFHASEVERNMADKSRTFRIQMGSYWRENGAILVDVRPLTPAHPDSTYKNPANRQIRITKMSDSEFTLNFPNYGDLALPYSLIDHLWKKDDGKIGMILQSRIILNKGHFEIISIELPPRFQ
jgi:hypothetical protein